MNKLSPAMLAALRVLADNLSYESRAISCSKLLDSTINALKRRGLLTTDANNILIPNATGLAALGISPVEESLTVGQLPNELWKEISPALYEQIRENEQQAANDTSVRPEPVEGLGSLPVHASTSSARTVIHTKTHTDMDALVSAIRFSSYYRYETWIDDQMFIESVDNRAGLLFNATDKRLLAIHFCLDKHPIIGTDEDYARWAKGLNSLYMTATRKNWYTAYRSARILSRHGDGILPPVTMFIQEVN